MQRETKVVKKWLEYDNFAVGNILHEVNEEVSELCSTKGWEPVGNIGVSMTSKRVYAWQLLVRDMDGHDNYISLKDLKK